MVESGTVNRELARVLATIGHQDEIILSDAGFAIPTGPEVIDLSLDENIPRVEEILRTLLKVFSVEGVVIAKEFTAVNPSKADGLKKILGADVTWEEIDHQDLKVRSRTVKAVIRSGDFAAYSNLLLISGSGGRWYRECPDD